MLPQKLLQVLRKQPPQKRSKKLQPMPLVPQNALNPDPPADEGGLLSLFGSAPGSEA